MSASSDSGKLPLRQPMPAIGATRPYRDRPGTAAKAPICPFLQAAHEWPLIPTAIIRVGYPSAKILTCRPVGQSPNERSSLDRFFRAIAPSVGAVSNPFILDRNQEARTAPRKVCYFSVYYFFIMLFSCNYFENPVYWQWRCRQFNPVWQHHSNL